VPRSLERLTPPARRALWRRGLLTGAWPQRLAEASDWLFFGNRRQRVLSQLAIHLAYRIAERTPVDLKHMRFVPGITYTANGLSSIGITVLADGVHYVLLPGSRLAPKVVHSHMRRTAVLQRSPREVRWVFDRTRLGVGRAEITRRLRGILSHTSSRPEDRRWQAALDEIVMLV
jgi:hypothetical protein